MKQLEFERVNGWGGKRRGAGRKNVSGEVCHVIRPRISARDPLHINIKVNEKVTNLRDRKVHAAFLKCVERAKAKGLRINQYSILSNHLHLIAEADDNKALERGMKSLVSRFARMLQKICGIVGAVFLGRFHLEILRSPTQMRNALRYVLLNFAHHMGLMGFIDDFSSAHSFPEWGRLIGNRYEPMLRKFAEEKVRRPPPSALSVAKSWLGSLGWHRARWA